MNQNTIAVVASMFVATASLGLGIAGARAAAPSQCADPTGAHGCFTSIQAAIDAAQPGAIVSVYPGTYSETASGRWVLGTNGPHQFGLFIGSDRSGVTIQGVDAKGHPIRDHQDVQAVVTTNATNNFGYSGTFVEGDDVTITGLEISVNLPWSEKTIEVIGDGFTLKDCDITDAWGSVYLNDWRFDADNNVSHVRRYEISENNFRDSASIDIASGAGYSGRVQDRRITKNAFANADYWPSISFNGSDTGVPWFVYSVGGAQIIDNTFVNTFEWTTGDPDVYLRTEGHIRARGTYDNSQFNWDQYFNANKFDEAYATGPKPPKDLRGYAYPGFYGTYYNVRRIGALLAGEQAIAGSGDTTAVKPH